MVARRILAGLLVAMAAGQAVSFPTFVDALETYEFAPDALVPAVAVALVGAEALAGFGLWRRHTTAAAALAVAVTIVWSILAVQAFARGLVVPNCGCFGRYLRQELRWWVLVEDAEFFLLALWVSWSARRGGHPSPLPARLTRCPSQRGSR